MKDRLFFALIFIFFNVLLFAETNSSVKNDINLTIQNKEKIKSIDLKLSILDKELNNDIWTRKYSNYITYTKLLKDLKKIEKEIQRAKKYRKYRKDLDSLLEEKKIIESQLSLLKDYKESPFNEILKPQDIPEPPQVKNPFVIIEALSYIKQISSQKSFYKNLLKEIKYVLSLLVEKRELLQEKFKLTNEKSLKDEIKMLDLEIKDFESAVKTGEKTIDVYEKRVDEVVFKVTEDIKNQTQKAAQIAAIVLILIIFNLIIKWTIKRYIKDSERFYMANKAINFIFATIVIFILLFAYIENVSYIVTILGFASAGIAIAMKDMFMSLLGWSVIVFGGSIHVGDRIKVKKNGLVYVGDVIDISMLRITIFEDVTLTSYLENRRAGRIIFIPNNYIFTDLIANYTHSRLKTVWDGIDITITFDSNYKKAAHIAKEIARRYAKGYIDITRKQLNRLRNSYHLKNTNVDTRVYTFAEDYGIRVSVWYLTNSYATLTLRSTISTEIVDAFLKEDDIELAYPTQTVALTKDNKIGIDNSKIVEEG